MGLSEKTTELVNTLKTTSEFTELKKSVEVIKRNGALKSEVEGFLSRQKELYGTKLSSKEAEYRALELNTKFSELSRIPEVGSYLKASQKFNDMMSKIYKFIGESIEADLKF